MKNLVAELLIKLAEKDEEHRLLQERLTAMELIVASLLETITPEARTSFQQTFESLTHPAANASAQRQALTAWAGCLEKIAAMKQL